jgi:hypothetical protein
MEEKKTSLIKSNYQLWKCFPLYIITDWIKGTSVENLFLNMPKLRAMRLKNKSVLIVCIHLWL